MELIRSIISCVMQLFVEHEYGGQWVARFGQLFPDMYICVETSSDMARHEST